MHKYQALRRKVGPPLDMRRNIDQQEMTSHKNSCMFHKVICHTIRIKYEPGFFTKVLSTVFFYTGSIFYNFYKHRELLYGTKIYSIKMSGTIVNKGNGHMVNIKYQFKFHSFGRFYPRKKSYNIILVLANYF